MHLFGVFEEGLFSLLQADAVDYALALAALQTCFDHGKVRRVDTQGHLHTNTEGYTPWVKLGFLTELWMTFISKKYIL